MNRIIIRRFIRWQLRGMTMKKSGMAVFVFLIILMAGCESRGAVTKAQPEKAKGAPAMVQIPVVKDFLPKFHFERRQETKTHVVLHFSSNAAMNLENPYIYEEIREIFVEYNVSPHYLIDRDGIVYFLLPENRVARHSGKGELTGYPGYKDRLNDFSIGIELMAIGTEPEMQSIISSEDYKKIPEHHIGYTEAQYTALNALLDDILTRNKNIKRDRKHIVGHNQYAPTRKTDPGTLFDWTRILKKADGSD